MASTPPPCPRKSTHPIFLNTPPSITMNAKITMRLSAIALATLLTACASGPGKFSYTVPDQPEGSTGYAEKPGWATQKFAVAAANPLATDAGYQVLKAGGSAVDAAIAVQMVLALVEPQSSGLGGGAFMLHFDGKAIEAYDGRETAPAAADERLFLGADGKPLPFYEAVVGGRSVGVPGTVRMLELAHQQHGKLPWARLFEPAITLAEGGFKVSARLNGLLASEKYLRNDPVAAAYFYRPDGTPRAVGETLRNPELAQVLRAIASNGSKAMLEGDVAKAIKDQKHELRLGLQRQFRIESIKIHLRFQRSTNSGTNARFGCRSVCVARRSVNGIPLNSTATRRRRG